MTSKGRFVRGSVAVAASVWLAGCQASPTSVSSAEGVPSSAPQPSAVTRTVTEVKFVDGKQQVTTRTVPADAMHARAQWVKAVHAARLAGRDVGSVPRPQYSVDTGCDNEFYDIDLYSETDFDGDLLCINPSGGSQVDLWLLYNPDCTTDVQTWDGCERSWFDWGDDDISEFFDGSGHNLETIGGLGGNEDDSLGIYVAAVGAYIS